MMAPVNNPINPEKINPPITPMKITIIGTGAPLPRRMGLSTLSDKPTTNSITVHMMPVVTPDSAKIYTIIGNVTKMTGICNTHNTNTKRVQIPAKGTPANRKIMPCIKANIRATPMIPFTTLPTVATVISANSSPFHLPVF